ncbi:MAG: hypothetical protein MI976_23105 [Pseudomonadales bacterium]|nr:hypothetical protein [Pseudomonadales bacterium]
MQEQIKTQIEQLKEQGEKLQVQVNKQLDKAKAEGLRILRELGAKVEDGETVSLNEVVKDIRDSNEGVRDFVRKLNVATYDNRFELNWNANMMSAYAKLQANKTYAKNVEPRLIEVRDSFEAQIKELSEKAKELRTKIAS